MCLSQSEQIERFIENGMPTKIVKTVQCTMRKRAKEQEREGTFAQPEIASIFNEGIAPNSEHDVVSKQESLETSTIQMQLKKPSASSINDDDHLREETKKNIVNIPKLCGRFRQLQHSEISGIENLVEGRPSPNNEQNAAYTDALATATQLTKRFTNQVNDFVHKMQTTKLYTILSRTTQPSHVLAVSVLTFIVFTICPKLVEDNSFNEGQILSDTLLNNNNKSSNTNTFAVIAFLAAFATHFGAQIWMTFVSGLALYFSLPRHTFGQCQQILFPKYFALNAILSMCMLVLFVKYFLISWTCANTVQLITLVMSCIIQTVIRLYLAPPMLLLMHEKYKIEGALGSGQEVGGIIQGDLVNCPHYQRIHKAFRRKHMMIAIGNMIVLLATSLQLYFLALKIQIH